MLRYGITLQTLKKTDEIGITGIVSIWPVNLFTGKAIHLHNVLTGSKMSTFFGRGWILTSFSYGFYNECRWIHTLNCKVFQTYI